MEGIYMNEAAVRLADHPVFADAIQYQIVGLTIVMLALGGLSLACGALGYLFRALESRGKKVIAAPEPSTPVEVREPLPIVAVIAAAVATTISAPHRIKTICLEPEDRKWDTRLSAWSVEGRKQITSSHKLR